MNILGLTGLNELSVWMTELKNSIGSNLLLVIIVEYLPRVYNLSVFLKKKGWAGRFLLTANLCCRMRRTVRTLRESGAVEGWGLALIH